MHDEISDRCAAAPLAELAKRQQEHLPDKADICPLDPFAPTRQRPIGDNETNVPPPYLGDGS